MMAAALIGLAWMALPGQAANSGYSPDAVQIYGGLNSPGEIPNQAPVYRDIRRRIVDFPTALTTGSIVVRTGERKLYFILGDGKAIEYPVGVGRDGFEWSGTDRITRKAEWPEWRPPPMMIAREAARGRDIPEYMPGGPANPLGARALYIGDTEYRIHGTSQPWSIGMAVSSGCIRMLNEQVIDLYDRVQLGATVVVE
jgi:lipoprotein-anchoring transpeptidase ErfK/SrfK